MIFRQLLNEPIAAASYLIGCSATGTAAVVDPGLPAEQYALLAADKGLRITAILETHMHADYFSTGRALADLTGATIYAPRLAEVQFPHTPLDDGDCVQVGNITIRAMHTPGHTPEHLSYAVADTPRAERPWFVLTGDCLFVGDVGRADLVDLPQTGPDFLYASIFDKLLSLPDDTEIFPGHYGGSACGGKAMSGKVSSTIGFERRFNWALQAPDRQTFADWVSETPRAAVESVLQHRHTNQGRLPLPADYFAPTTSPTRTATVTALEPATAAASDATLIDLRAQTDFAAGHPHGAVNIVYNRDNLLERVAALTPADATLVCLADQPFVAKSAAELLAGAGRNPVVGYVNADFTAWQAADLPVAALPTLSLAELHEQVSSNGVTVLDVRDPFEWEKGVINGALQIALTDLREQLAAVPRERPVLVICESGMRASAAASLLLRAGYSDVANVAPEGVSEYLARYGN